jgi:hypothetical protein
MLVMYAGAPKCPENSPGMQKVRRRSQPLIQNGLCDWTTTRQGSGAAKGDDKQAAKERLEAILTIALTRPVVKKPAVAMGPSSKPAPAVKNTAAPAAAKPAASPGTKTH